MACAVNLQRGTPRTVAFAWACTLRFIIAFSVIQLHTIQSRDRLWIVSTLMLAVTLVSACTLRFLLAVGVVNLDPVWSLGKLSIGSSLWESSSHPLRFSTSALLPDGDGEEITTMICSPCHNDGRKRDTVSQEQTLCILAKTPPLWWSL